MIRIATKIAYLGEGFSGSQIQPGCRTVEGDIISAVRRACKHSDLRMASRTDKGVNATGNVAVFHSDLEDPDAVLRALNAMCDDVHFLSYAIVDDEFNPRHATQREYRYVLRSPDADADKARDCASLFVGGHDFARFCRPDGKPTVATVDSIDISQEGGNIIMTYRARFFLWNMVRRTAAAIDSVASGHSTLDDVEEALAGKEINFGIGRADALTLTDVRYDGIDFRPSDSRVLMEKLDEGAFKASLRRSFYESMM